LFGQTILETFFHTLILGSTTPSRSNRESIVKARVAPREQVIAVYSINKLSYGPSKPNSPRASARADHILMQVKQSRGDPFRKKSSKVEESISIADSEEYVIFEGREFYLYTL